MAIWIKNLMGTIINGALQAGRTEDKGGVHAVETGPKAGKHPTETGFTDEPRPRAPRANTSNYAGAVQFCGRDWVVGSLKVFAEVPDRDLRQLKEMKPMAETMLSHCMGFQIKFSDDPREAKAFARRFADALEAGKDNQTAYNIAKGETSPDVQPTGKPVGDGSGIENASAEGPPAARDSEPVEAVASASADQHRFGITPEEKATFISNLQELGGSYSLFNQPRIPSIEEREAGARISEKFKIAAENGYVDPDVETAYKANREQIQRNFGMARRFKGHTDAPSELPPDAAGGIIAIHEYLSNHVYDNV